MKRHWRIRRKHAAYMRAWRERDKERQKLAREDLTNFMIRLDRRKKWFLEQMAKGEDLENVKLFNWALRKYDTRGGIPR